jgi:hypothetical protein
MEGERQRVKEIEYVLVRVLFRIRSPQDCFQDRPCNRIQEAFSSEPCLGYVLFNIVLRHGTREAESQGERICSSQIII